MAQFRMFKFVCEDKTLVVQTLGAMFNTGLQRHGQQFPCILRVASTKRLKSFALYNVHEKSLIEGEFEFNY